MRAAPCGPLALCGSFCKEKKREFELGTMWSFAQLFLFGLESTVHCVILSVLFFSN